MVDICWYIDTALPLMCCNRSAGIDKTLFVCQLFCLNICQVYLFDGWTSCASSVFIAVDEIRSHFCWIESLREITIFDRVSVGSNHHFPWAFPVRNRKIPGFFPKIRAEVFIPFSAKGVWCGDVRFRGWGMAPEAPWLRLDLSNVNVNYRMGARQL